MTAVDRDLAAGAATATPPAPAPAAGPTGDRRTAAAPSAVPGAPSLYDRTATRASHAVLASYSTSFGLGARLLDRETREHIDAVYGLVRIADEVVDTHQGEEAARVLDELETETARALERGWSTNLVVHAFARTAARTGIGHAEIDPFFRSMRADLTVRVHDRASYEDYVYGSAEVVGLMCLAVFLNGTREPREPLVVPSPETVAGARALGAAFQKINFLRDLRADYEDLGRSYLPGVTPDSLDEEQLAAVLAEIGRDVATARAAVPHLPVRPRLAVAATVALYESLLVRLTRTRPEELLQARVRVPDAVKGLVAVRAVTAQLAAWRPGAR